jgi:glutathione S-transferase
MTTQVTLYGPDYSTFTRTARMALAEKGVEYTLQPVDVLQGEHQSDAHVARHPFGKVPSLNHDGNDVYETSAIVRYIDNAFGGPSLQADDPKNAARMNQVIGVIDSYGYGPCIGQAFIQRAVVPMLGGEADEAVITEAVGKAHNACLAIEKLANADGFLVDKKLTLADLYLVPVYDYVSQIPEGEQILAGCDKLASWWTRMQNHPSVTSTKPQLG